MEHLQNVQKVYKNALVEHPTPMATPLNAPGQEAVTASPTTNSANSKPQKLSIPSSIPATAPYQGHGNKRNNSNPHMVYVFTFLATDGKTPVLKYGVADIYKNIERPESQEAYFKTLYGASVTWRVVTYTPNRDAALAVEDAAVQRHKAQWDGARPREQILPK
jgi:hypothetical protein